MSNSKQNLSKGILQEGHKELIGEASPTAPPSNGVPGQKLLKQINPFLVIFVDSEKGEFLDTSGTRTAFTLPPLCLN